MNKKLFTYKKSGVNIDAADSFVNFISAVSSKKKGKKKFSNIGGFGSISDIPNHIKQPKIVACTDDTSIGDSASCSSFSDCDSYVAIATANRQRTAKAPSLAGC